MSYTYEYPRPCVTVDCVIFRMKENRQVLLIRRKFDPFKDKWAFPGGFVDMDETLEHAAARELKEETGLEGIDLEQLHAFSSIHRDPRARTIGIAFYGFLEDNDKEAIGGDDAAEAHWFDINDIPPLAFDHAEILRKALEKIS
jgi:8-oxo-dGTP diphosphatase